MSIAACAKKFGELARAAVVGVALLAAIVGASRAEGVKSAIEPGTALVLSVDVSDSVDAERYRLQIEGIARALEDSSVIAAIMDEGGIMISLVLWADRAQVALDWQVISSIEDGRRVAGMVRALPQTTGEFTCVSHMFEFVRETMVSRVLPGIAHVVVDVSGDGIDNCAVPDETARQRDALLALGVTINGLPILVEGENDIVGSGAYRAPGWQFGLAPIDPSMNQTTLDDWYRRLIIGGPGNFLLPAYGFQDFGRAFRQKFVTEISALQPPD